MIKKFFSKKKQKIHFLHIGKTGGTSLISMLKDSPSSQYEFVIHSHEVSLKDIPNREKVIFFLRNPITRFVSGFYSRKRKGLPVYNVPYNKEEEIAFNLFETPNKLAENLNSQDANARESAVKAMEGIRHVNTHFSDWLIDKAYVKKKQKRIFYIGFQEDFDIDAMRLHEKITGNEMKKNFTRMHENPQSNDKYLSDLAIMNLKNWYSEDFKLYDFCKTLSKDVN